VQLPSRYLLKEWRSLSLLLGPGMVSMWLCSSLIIWALVPHISFLHALAVGACVTPTDPVLSNSIVKGKFADKNIPKPLQKIIIAESGANDGLGYPFLFLPLYLIKYTGDSNTSGNAGTALGLWLGETWGYTIILSVLYGATVGYIAKELLHWAEEHKFVDRESFLVFAITLALFIVGTCGMIGSDDVLACFIAGNVFTIEYVVISILQVGYLCGSSLSKCTATGSGWKLLMTLCSLRSICFSTYPYSCGLELFVHGPTLLITTLFPFIGSFPLVFSYYFLDVYLLFW
jgi:NhaP-type Na+/H+ or K+/H+ antiporter